MRFIHSLFVKLLFCLLLISVLPLSIVGYLIYENTSSKMTENLNYHANYTLQQKAQSLEKFHDQLNRLGGGIVANTVFSEFSENTDYKRHQQLFLELDKLLISLDNAFPYYKGITLINEENLIYHYGYSIKNNVKANDFLQTEWFQNLNKQHFPETSSLHENTYSVPSQSASVYSFIYEGWDRKLKNRSIILIDFTKEYLSNILEVSSDEDEVTGSLVYNNHKIVYSKEQVPTLSYQEITTSPSGSIVRDQKNELDYIIYKQKVPKLDWTIVEYFDVKNLYKPVHDIKFFFIITILITIFICIGASLFVTRQISSPIYKLQKKMKKVEHGDFEEEFITNSKDVIGDLANGFNQMLFKIKALIKNLEKEEKLKREAEITALQLQINPHFLYNTLESINSLARKSKQYEISHLIVLLGRLLRMSISSFEEKVPIDKEITYIQYYLEIQQIRMRYPLEFDIAIAPEIGSKKIVKWILQPFVENAIIHGIDPKRAPSHITINGNLEGDNIIFTISDNGVGIDQPKLEKIKKQLRNNSPELVKYERRIGIHNVQSRILLHYGSNYGIEIESKKGSGTTIRMIIPKRGDKNG